MLVGGNYGTIGHIEEKFRKIWLNGYLISSGVDRIYGTISRLVHLFRKSNAYKATMATHNYGTATHNHRKFRNSGNCPEIIRKFPKNITELSAHSVKSSVNIIKSLNIVQRTVQSSDKHHESDTPRITNC